VITGITPSLKSCDHCAKDELIKANVDINIEKTGSSKCGFDI
jgi:hypothetical protein